MVTGGDDLFFNFNSIWGLLRNKKGGFVFLKNNSKQNGSAERIAASTRAAVLSGEGGGSSYLPDHTLVFRLQLLTVFWAKILRAQFYSVKARIKRFDCFIRPQ